MQPPNLRSVAWGAIAFVLVGAGCASATKRYEQGQELEQQGKPADAAQRYIATLKKDPTYSEARARLVDVGRTAIADYARQADGFASAGAYTDAADALWDADALLRDASGVGVALQLPTGYGERHQTLFGRAVDQATSGAVAASSRGDFSEALRLVERAGTRWQPTVDQQYALTRAVYETQLAWARAEMSAQRFRSAYAHADLAAQVPGSNRRDIDQIQRQALARGSALVAAFPIVARAGVDDRLLPELDDRLVLDQWQRPPQWLGTVNATEMRRIVRLRGLTGRELDPNDAVTLARQVAARFAVALTLDTVRYSESKVEKKRRPARTRSGVDTAFTIEDGQLELRAHANWRTMDVAAGRNVIDRGDASDRQTTSFRRAVYAGNWRDLDLSTQDRALFEARDPKDSKDAQDAQRRVARSIAERIGRDVFDALVRRIE